MERLLILPIAFLLFNLLYAITLSPHLFKNRDTSLLDNTKSEYLRIRLSAGYHKDRVYKALRLFSIASSLSLREVAK